MGKPKRVFYDPNNRVRNLRSVVTRLKEEMAAMRKVIKSADDNFTTFEDLVKAGRIDGSRVPAFCIEVEETRTKIAKLLQSKS